MNVKWVLHDDLSPATRALVMAGRLGAARPAHGLAMACLVTALLQLISANGLIALIWILVLFAGILETWYAARIHFDQIIFTAWAIRWNTQAAQAESDMNAFDTALHPNQPPAPRNLTARLAGTRKLARKQIACVLFQLGAVALALAMRGGYGI